MNGVVDSAEYLRLRMRLLEVAERLISHEIQIMPQIQRSLVPAGAGAPTAPPPSTGSARGNTTG
jgi:hypothetical protein